MIFSQQIKEHLELEWYPGIVCTLYIGLDILTLANVDQIANTCRVLSFPVKVSKYFPYSFISHNAVYKRAVPIICFVTWYIFRMIQFWIVNHSCCTSPKWSKHSFDTIHSGNYCNDMHILRQYQHSMNLWIQNSDDVGTSV
jgi:hypothetical protein